MKCIAIVYGERADAVRSSGRHNLSKSVTFQKPLNLALPVEHCNPVLARHHGQIQLLRGICAFYSGQIGRRGLLAELLL